MTTTLLREGWQLLVRVSVDKSRRVQCQCCGCGKTIYADIHIIRWPDGEIACWGSRCFEREMGISGKNAKAVYSRVNGRKLTNEERDLLDANRTALIARIKGVEEELEQTEKRREQALKKMAGPVVRSRPASLVSPLKPSGDTPRRTAPSLPVNFDERSHKYSITFRNQAGDIIKRLYRGNEQFCRRFIAENIATYPPGTMAELTVTLTGRVIDQQRKI